MPNWIYPVSQRRFGHQFLYSSHCSFNLSKRFGHQFLYSSWFKIIQQTNLLNLTVDRLFTGWRAKWLKALFPAGSYSTLPVTIWVLNNLGKASPSTATDHNSFYNPFSHSTRTSAWQYHSSPLIFIPQNFHHESLGVALWPPLSTRSETAEREIRDGVGKQACGYACILDKQDIKK